MLSSSIPARCGLFAAISLLAACAPRTEIVDMRCEYIAAPIAIDTDAPRFTWHYGERLPASSHVEIASSPDGFDDETKVIWRSAEAEGDDMYAVYDGKTPLRPHTTYYWRVVTPENTSETASFSTAKFKPEDWTGVWISDTLDREYEPAPMFRKTFNVDKVDRNALLYIAAAGYYQVWINGERVGDSHMDPGYTHYDRRNLYATHRVGKLLHQGENVITAVAGNGFYNCQSKAVWDFETARWRNRPAIICEILAENDNAERKPIVATDSTWLTATGPYTYNNIYSGDRYDARLEPQGWQQSGFDDSSWSRAVAVASPSPLLKSQTNPAIRSTKSITPELLSNFGDTVYVFDMKKNISGVCRISLKGEEGTHLRLSHGELLDSLGRLEQGNINIYYRPEKEGEKFQTDEFILAGTGDTETFMPGFTYHGFRYVEVKSDRPVSLSSSDITGEFMHTDVQPAGSFSCSDKLLNKIYDATMQSYLGNLHSIPTDCPQREKNGWTADAHAAMDLALLNFDGITLYEKWLNDFIDNQRPDGAVSGIIPSSGWGYGQWPGPVWDAAMFIIPEALYNYYGDTRAITALYPTMQRYMAFTRANGNEDGLLDYGLGDWLPWQSTTPSGFTSSVYYYLDNKKMAKFAAINGDDPAPYEAKADSVLTAINRVYFNPADSTYANGTQAALGVALYSGIVPDDKAQAVADKLNAMITANDYALDFGLLGTKTVLRMLTRYGHFDTAYAMATRTDAPSWGYWIDKCGYTTLPETWTLSPRFNDASLNHVFFGDISAWMTNDIAGLNFDPANPGFRHIIFTPHFPEGLDWAEATYNSVRGTVASQWERMLNGEIRLTLTVPAGSTATLRLPDDTRELESGTHTITIPA